MFFSPHKFVRDHFRNTLLSMSAGIDRNWFLVPKDEGDAVNVHSRQITGAAVVGMATVHLDTTLRSAFKKVAGEFFGKKDENLECHFVVRLHRIAFLGNKVVASTGGPAPEAWRPQEFVLATNLSLDEAGALARELESGKTSLKKALRILVEHDRGTETAKLLLDDLENKLVDVTKHVLRDKSWGDYRGSYPAGFDFTKK